MSIYGESRMHTYLSRIKARWADRVTKGSTQLCLARRIDPAARGTHHIALYTRNPSFTGHGGWGFRNISDSDAKLLCLWFNSSIFFLQLIEQRTQTRGTWWRLDKHRWGRTMIPDLSALPPLQRKKLLELFDDLGNVSFPNLLEQLKVSFGARSKLDDAWLSIIGMSKARWKIVIPIIHKHLYQTLLELMQAMERD